MTNLKDKLIKMYGKNNIRVHLDHTTKNKYIDAEFLNWVIGIFEEKITAIEKVLGVIEWSDLTKKVMEVKNEKDIC